MIHRQEFANAGQAAKRAPRSAAWTRLRRRLAGTQGVRFGVLRTGVILMVAFPLAYAAWTALVVALPDAAAALFSLLVHGLALPRPGESIMDFSFTGFALATAWWAVKGLVFGLVFAVVYNALNRET